MQIGERMKLVLFRRSRMNPLWNNLIVAGIETESDNKPFIGVITQRGVAYTVNFQCFPALVYLREELSKNYYAFSKDEYFNIAKIILYFFR